MYCNKWFLSSDTKVPQGDSGFSHERCGPRVGGGREAEQVLIASGEISSNIPARYCFCHSYAVDLENINFIFLYFKEVIGIV